MTDDHPVTLAEVKELLEEEQKKRAELTPEQKVSLDHATKVARLKPSEAKKLKKEMKELGFVPELVAVEDSGYPAGLPGGRASPVCQGKAYTR